MKKLFILLTAITTLYSCQKEELSLTVSPNEITLYAEGTKQITTNVIDATYSSQDEFYASVDPKGLVSANKVGSTLIKVSGNGETKTIPITILSKYTLYPNLDQLIGKTKADVKNALGLSYIEKNNIWTYKNLTSYASIGVIFKDEKVESAVAFVSTIYTTQLVNYLTERYAIAGMQNDFYFFLNHDKNVMIGTTVYSVDYLGVAYMAYSGFKSAESVMPTIELLDVLNNSKNNDIK